MRTAGLALISGLLFLGCGKNGEAAPDTARQDEGPDGVDSFSPQPVDSSDAIDSAGQFTGRDATKVQAVTVTAAQVFMVPTVPFLREADLTRGTDGLFDFNATVQVSLSGCTGDKCNRYVSMRLSREQTTRVEGSLALISGQACQDDPGPICDFDIHYAIGIDGPPQNQTCCKRNEWGQNSNVTGLHGYLQSLAVAQLNPVDGSAG
jgi:hypothetical protein